MRMVRHVFGGLYVELHHLSGRPFVRFRRLSSMLQAVRDSFEASEVGAEWHAGVLPPVEEMGYLLFQLDAIPLT